MTIFERVMADMTASQKAGAKDKLAALRLIVNSLKNEAKDLRQPDLTDEQAVKVLQREVKKRREAIEAFQAGGRSELAAQEQLELGLISPYLPEQLDEAGIGQLIDQVIKEQVLQTPYDFGRLMGVVMKALAGRADGQLVRQLVQKKIDSQ